MVGHRPVSVFATLCGLTDSCTCVELFDFITTYDINFQAPPQDAFLACTLDADIVSIIVALPLDEVAAGNDPLTFLYTLIFIPLHTCAKHI